LDPSARSHPGLAPLPPAQAKTIDLCNNPKTKEPKLQAARRILPEWEGLDRLQAEATRIAEEILGLGLGGNAAIAAAEPAAAAEDELLLEAAAAAVAADEGPVTPLRAGSGDGHEEL